MESVLVMCNSGPFGTNSTYESIRLGSGFMGLGEDINCKILFYGDAVLSVKKNLNSGKIGMDSFEEGLEMADLSELPIIVIEEDLITRGMTTRDLFEFEDCPIQVIKENQLGEIMTQFDAVFQM
ncbi:DsrE family protein [Promethearchaeum syntrophicum]|uniref:DsrE family protein n=1 Tax=Promethearchaeum syntrophicum TaxID=2594042 RepID=A0A5B9D9P5_9ARCH|nr:DsrE family protein [Candidatus Prometheoarchaeum syntrophicum]QEE15316.1 DsrE/DsrF-like family protein [Candidatus Prometheoarchaeum syntrophicum]